MRLSAVGWLYGVTGRYRTSVAVLLVVQAVLGACSVAFALLLRGAIDSAVDGDESGFYTYLAALVGLVVVQTALRAVVRHLEELSRASIENALKGRLFGNLMRKDYASVTATHSGEWLNRLTSDTVVCANGVVEVLPGVAGTLVKLVGALVAVLALEPKAAYVLLPGGALTVCLTYASRKVMKRLHSDVQESDGRLRVFLQERLGSTLVVRSYAAEAQTESDARERMSDHRGARMRRNRFSNLCSVGFSVATYGTYLIGLGYCGHGILVGSVSYGTLTAVLQLVGQVQSPLVNVTGYLPRFYATVASAERLMEVETFADDCPNGAIGAEEVHEFYEESLEAVVFEGATFSYRDAESVAVVQDVSLRVDRGEYVAFTGHSGCGKSTLLKLLMCLYPLDGGERYLLKRDGSRESLTAEWHRLFAYVPQGNYLTCGTVRETVSFADVDAASDDERLRYALEVACADEFVDGLEDGLDTVLGERGQGLSEGQMQRVAVARAILSDSPILLLDESTSALDEQTERRLLQNLRSMTDRTVLIVTHRPAVLDVCDRVVRVAEGGIEVVG